MMPAVAFSKALHQIMVKEHVNRSCILESFIIIIIIIIASNMGNLFWHYDPDAANASVFTQLSSGKQAYWLFKRVKFYVSLNHCRIRMCTYRIPPKNLFGKLSKTSGVSVRHFHCFLFLFILMVLYDMLRNY